MRDAIQRLALANRHYGYRRIAALLGREGWQANHKRVLRLMHQDNLLCLRKAAFVPITTDRRHGWRVVPNLARGMELSGLDQLWIADITYLHLAEEFGYLAIVLDASFFRRCVEVGQKDGSIADTHPADELAKLLLSVLLGIRVLARTRPQREVLEGAANAVLGLLGSGA